ncbi:hypothetical protein DIPPA_35351 [Diplonema papillatum]|nr:hypothetical protein DIPPA_35351 [Diplonema papillatum]
MANCAWRTLAFVFGCAAVDAGAGSQCLRSELKLPVGASLEEGCVAKTGHGALKRCRVELDGFVCTDVSCEHGRWLPDSVSCIPACATWALDSDMCAGSACEGLSPAFDGPLALADFLDVARDKGPLPSALCNTAGGFVVNPLATISCLRLADTAVVDRQLCVPTSEYGFSGDPANSDLSTREHVGYLLQAQNTTDDQRAADDDDDALPVWALVLIILGAIVLCICLVYGTQACLNTRTDEAPRPPHPISSTPVYKALDDRESIDDTSAAEREVSDALLRLRSKEMSEVAVAKTWEDSTPFDPAAEGIAEPAHGEQPAARFDYDDQLAYQPVAANFGDAYRAAGAGGDPAGRVVQLPVYQQYRDPDAYGTVPDPDYNRDDDHDYDDDDNYDDDPYAPDNYQSSAQHYQPPPNLSPPRNPNLKHPGIRRKGPVTADLHPILPQPVRSPPRSSIHSLASNMTPGTSFNASRRQLLSAVQTEPSLQGGQMAPRGLRQPAPAMPGTGASMQERMLAEVLALQVNPPDTVQEGDDGPRPPPDQFTLQPIVDPGDHVPADTEANNSQYLSPQPQQPIKRRPAPRPAPRR